MNHVITQCRECGYGYPIIEGVHCRCPNCDQPDATAKEQVDHPSHYGGDQPYEVIKVLEAWFPDEQSEAFCLCNAIKYIARAGKKTPDKLEDLKKAQWYLSRVIENLKKEK